MSEVPQNLKYSTDHEWVRVDGARAFIGITDFAQDELGDIVFVELPEVGTTMTAGETFGTVESVKTVSDLVAPLTGRIVEVNMGLTDAPESVNSSPYGDGWMVVLELADEGELNELLDMAAYTAHIEA